MFLEQRLACVDGERADFEPVERALALVHEVCANINHSLDEMGTMTGAATVECANPLHALVQQHEGVTASSAAQSAPRKKRLSQLISEKSD